MNAVLFASPFQISGSVQLDSLASHNLIQSTKCFHTLTKEKFQCCCCCFLVGLFSPVAADERFEGKALSRPDWCPLSCVHYLGILSIMHVYNFTTNQLTFSLLPISSFFFCWLRFLSNWPLYIIDQQRDFFMSVELFVIPLFISDWECEKTPFFFLHRFDLSASKHWAMI